MFSLNSDQILTKDQMKMIKAGECTSFSELISCSCTCKNGSSFTAVVIDDCDVAFYVDHFCASESMECTCQS